MPPPHRPEFAEFVADIEPSLRRALAEEFGPAAGREATVDALAFAWANWDRVASADDATAYLLKVGQTAAERHRPLATGDVTPLLPRSQAAFDALVPPIGADAAMDRAAELVTGAPTTMLSRPEAPTTVVATTAASSASRYADGPATMRLPVPPSPTAGTPMRRTIPWVVAAVLVGVIALGGIALANRSDDGPGGTDTSLLPTLPTAVTVSTVASSAASPPPADPSLPVSDPVVDTLPPDDGDDTATTPATRPPTSAATTPPATNLPQTDPPATDPPATNPPSSAATTPPSTPAPSTALPDTTLPPRPTVPDDVTG